MTFYTRTAQQTHDALEDALDRARQTAWKITDVLSTDQVLTGDERRALRVARVKAEQASADLVTLLQGFDVKERRA